MFRDIYHIVKTAKQLVGKTIMARLDRSVYRDGLSQNQKTIRARLEPDISVYTDQFGVDVTVTSLQLHIHCGGKNKQQKDMGGNELDIFMFPILKYL